jgi:biotin operon repressor
LESVFPDNGGYSFNQYITAEELSATVGISKRKILDNINKLKVMGFAQTNWR